MDIKIRRAEVKDIADVAKLLYQVHDVHAKGRPDLFVAGLRKYDDEQLKSIFSDESTPVLVADDGEHVVGYAFCIFQKETSPSHVPHTTLYLDDLCVDESARGKHIGTMLYDAVIALAKKTDCYRVTLNVWSCNESAMRFYEKLGLSPLKITMEKLI